MPAPGPKFQPTAGKLSENLEAAGIDPDNHHQGRVHPRLMPIISGARSTISTMAERFPNASYVISAAEWDFWTDPKTASARAGLAARAWRSASARILKKIENKIERRKAGDTRRARPDLCRTAGHTPGHMAVWSKTADERR